MKVYALGVMQIEYDHRSEDGKEPSFFIKTDRLWSLYSSFEKAEEAMLNNYGDLFEYYYNLGLIEEVYVIGDDEDASITYQGGERRWWYLAEYETDSEAPFGKKAPKISKIECPSFFERTVNFWVG